MIYIYLYIYVYVYIYVCIYRGYYGDPRLNLLLTTSKFQLLILEDPDWIAGLRGSSQSKETLNTPLQFSLGLGFRV